MFKIDELRKRIGASRQIKKLEQVAEKAAITASLILTMTFGGGKQGAAAPHQESNEKTTPRIEISLPTSEVINISKTDCLFREEAFARRLAAEHSLEFFGNMFYLNDLIRTTRAQGYKEQLIKEVADYVFKSGGLSGSSNYCVMSGALSARQAVETGEQNSKIAALISHAVERIFPEDKHSNVSCPKFLEHIRQDKELSRFLHECRNNLKETIKQIGVGGILISRVPGNNGVSTSSGMHFTCIGPKWVQDQYQEHKQEIKTAAQIIREKGRANVRESIIRMRRRAPDITSANKKGLSDEAVYVGANGESSGRTDVIAAKNSGYYFDYCGAVASLITREMQQMQKEELAALLQEKLPSDKVSEGFNQPRNSTAADLAVRHSSAASRQL